MRKLLLLFLLLATNALAFLPNSTVQSVTGTATTATTVCTLVAPNASGYTVILDGTAVATAAITVAIQILDPSNNTYSAPQVLGSSGGTAQAAGTISVTNALDFVVFIPGSAPGIRVVVTSFSTATGTFNAAIIGW